jgi:hypothetical protein
LITVKSVVGCRLSDWWIDIKREDCCGEKVVAFCFGALFIKMKESESPLDNFSSPRAVAQLILVPVQLARERNSGALDKGMNNLTYGRLPIIISV